MRLNIDNVFEFLRLANLYKFEEVQSACVELVVTHQEEKFKSGTDENFRNFVLAVGQLFDVKNTNTSELTDERQDDGSHFESEGDESDDYHYCDWDDDDLTYEADVVGRE